MIKHNSSAKRNVEGVMCTPTLVKRRAMYMPIAISHNIEFIMKALRLSVAAVIDVAVPHLVACCMSGMETCALEHAPNIGCYSKASKDTPTLIHMKKCWNASGQDGELS
eukprot:3127736-Amphidinium_carterae.1